MKEKKVLPRRAEQAALEEALAAMADEPEDETEDGAGAAHEIAISDDGSHRRLVFGPEYVQSQMDLDDPWALNLQYTQKMMAFLLFVPKPRHVVMVGLGGGSLTKFCHRHLPKARTTTIEIDARVIALARQFKVPLDEPRTRIVHADACEWFAREDAELADVILLDGYTEAGIAGGFGDASFHDNLYKGLRPGGMLVANLLVPADSFRHYRTSIAARFGEPVLVQRVVPDGNQVLFAFKSPKPTFEWTTLARDAKKLQARLGLDFPAFARALRRSHERQSNGPSNDHDAEPTIAML